MSALKHTSEGKQLLQLHHQLHHPTLPPPSPVPPAPALEVPGVFPLTHPRVELPNPGYGDNRQKASVSAGGADGAGAGSAGAGT